LEVSRSISAASAAAATATAAVSTTATGPSTAATAAVATTATGATTAATAAVSTAATGATTAATVAATTALTRTIFLRTSFVHTKGSSAEGEAIKLCNCCVKLVFWNVEEAEASVLNDAWVAWLELSRCIQQLVFCRRIGQIANIESLCAHFFLRVECLSGIWRNDAYRSSRNLSKAGN
jgi:hypothetical protein